MALQECLVFFSFKFCFPSMNNYKIGWQLLDTIVQSTWSTAIVHCTVYSVLCTMHMDPSQYVDFQVMIIIKLLAFKENKTA